MIQPKAIVSDFSWVLLHTVDRTFQGSLNGLNRQHGGEDGMGAYSFFDYFELNTVLLEHIASIKLKSNIPTYIFTTDKIQERPEVKAKLEAVFDRIISGREVKESGVTTAETLDAVKTDPNAYKYIAEMLGLKPEEILFIDDKAANLEAAQAAGYQVLLYARTPTMEESNKKAISQLDAIFGESTKPSQN